MRGVVAELRAKSRDSWRSEVETRDGFADSIWATETKKIGSNSLNFDLGEFMHIELFKWIWVSADDSWVAAALTGVGGEGRARARFRYGASSF